MATMRSALRIGWFKQVHATRPKRTADYVDDDNDSLSPLPSVAGVGSASDLTETRQGSALECLGVRGAKFRPAQESGLRQKPATLLPETTQQIW